MAASGGKFEVPVGYVVVPFVNVDCLLLARLLTLRPPCPARRERVRDVVLERGDGGPSAKDQAEMEAAEARVTKRINREGARVATRMGSLYRHGSGGYARARRILTPLTGRGEERKFGDGDVAHLVFLRRDPLADIGGLTGLCGTPLKPDQKWSGIKAFATCHLCLPLAKVQPPSDIGWEHKLSETQWHLVKQRRMVGCYPVIQDQQQHGRTS